MPRLIVRSVVGRNDRSHDDTIDRAIDGCTQRLIYDRRSGATTDHALGHTTIECSHDRSQDGTIDPTIGRRPSRLIVRHDWSYDRSSGAITDRSLHRSLIATTSRTISYDGSCHRYFRIVRDSATTRRYQSPYASAAGYRSKHCRSFAP